MQSKQELSAFALISQGKTIKKVKQSELEDPSNDVEIDNDDDSNDNEVDEDEVSPFRDPPEGCVRLRPSQFHGIPSTVFMEYPPELGIRRMDQSVIEPLGQRKMGYNSYWERVCIKNAHCRAGFVKTDKYWTSLWSKHQNASQMRELNCLQKVNHFPASWCIGRKDRLTRTLNTMKRIHGTNGSLFDIHPETFILPGERESLGRLIKSEIAQAQNATHKTKSFNSTSASMSAQGGMWIIKPCASSCGQGIKVMTGQQAAALPKRKKVIVQRYLARPYLIDGRKFDLRIYVLVSGVDPLRVYIHDEGLTRISTAKYTLKNLSNNFAHLTNYSINKNAPNFKAAEFNNNPSSHGNEEEEGDDGNDVDSPMRAGSAAGAEGGGSAAKDPEMEGFKWSLAAFRRWLAQKEGVQVMEQTFDRIFDLCLKSVIAAEGEITPHLHSSAQYRTNCFELFGCDVILDSSLRPHLLEVNVSPSLMGSSPLDKKIKGMVVADLLHIVGLYPHDPALLKKYDTNKSAGASSSNSSSSSGKSGAGEVGNPFSFSSLSKMMDGQDKYRRSPSVESIEVAALGELDASWMLLLMAEDELLRAKSSKFHCVHPTAANAVYYTGLYRSVRFSDHLLAHWVIHGGSRGRYAKCIPQKYRPLHAQKVGALSPSKPSPSSGSRVEYTSLTGSAAKARAKSAGRTTSATVRAPTYNPNNNAAPTSTSTSTSEKTSLSSVHAADSHASRRSIYEQQQLLLQQQQQQQQQDAAHSAKQRGKSEPRSKGKGQSTSSPTTSPAVDQRVRSARRVRPAFASPGEQPLPPPTPSSLRSKLESGISKAAYYTGIADLEMEQLTADAYSHSNNSSRLNTGRRLYADGNSNNTDYDDSADRESTSISPSASGKIQQSHNTTGLLRPSRGGPRKAQLPSSDPSSSPSPSPSAASSGSIRPSSGTARSTVTHSDNGSTRSRTPRAAGESVPRSTLLDHTASSRQNASNPPAKSNSRLAASTSRSRSPVPDSRSHTRSTTPSISAVYDPSPAGRVMSPTGGLHSASPNIEDLNLDSPTAAKNRSPVPKKNRVDSVLVPSPTLNTRPVLTEFAMFNEQMRLAKEERVSCDSKPSSLHPDSPLKQRRVSLAKSNSGAFSTAGSNHANTGSGGGSVVHSLGLSLGHRASSLQSKDALLERVHKTLFRAVEGLTPSASSSTSPLQQPQGAAHPSFSQPISPTNIPPATGIQAMQSKVFGQNPVVVKAAATGRVLHYASGGSNV